MMMLSHSILKKEELIKEIKIVIIFNRTMLIKEHKLREILKEVNQHLKKILIILIVINLI